MQAIRTKEQVKALLNEIQLELDDPAIVFGREELVEFVEELEFYLTTGEVRDEDNEAGYWLVSEKSYLGKDYGIE